MQNKIRVFVKSLAILALFTQIICVGAQIEISEIMFKPAEGNEWVEFITGNENVNISGVQISDNYQADSILCCGNQTCSYIIPSQTYFLIFDMDTAFPLPQDKYYYCADDSLIGNGLGNSQDTILLIGKGEAILNTSYNLSVAQGNSISFVNGSWIETEATPWNQNAVVSNNSDGNQTTGNASAGNYTNQTIDMELTFYENEPLFNDISYTSFFKVKNLEYSAGADRIKAIIYYNISYLDDNQSECFLSGSTLNISLSSYTTKATSNITFNLTGTYKICGETFEESHQDTNVANNAICKTFLVINSTSVPCSINLSLETENQIYEKGERIEFRFALTNDTYPFEIEYWVEDLFFGIEKEPVKTANTETKYFTPSFAEKEKAVLLKANLTKLLCNNTSDRTEVQKLIVVRDSNITQNGNTTISVDKISPSELFFGEQIEVTLQIHKGDTRKTAVEISVRNENKKISETTSFNIGGKDVDLSLSVPVQLKPNCDKAYVEGEYNLSISGLDITVTTPISVKNNIDESCPVSKPAKKTATSSKSTVVPAEIAENNNLYELSSITKNIVSDEILVLIRLDNPDKKSHNYTIWSYIYNGPTCFSGEREENKKTLSLDNNTSTEVTLTNTLEATHPEKLNYKIKILRDDRKTPYEITSPLIINDSSETLENKSQEPNVEKTFESNDTAQVQLDKKDTKVGNSSLQLQISEPLNQTTEENMSKITGKLIYSSPSAKLKDYTIYFIMFVLSFVVFAVTKLKN